MGKVLSLKSLLYSMGSWNHSYQGFRKSVCFFVSCSAAVRNNLRHSTKVLLECEREQRWGELSIQQPQAMCSLPISHSQGRVNFTAKLFSRILSTNKTSFVLGGKESNTSWISDAGSFSPLLNVKCSQYSTRHSQRAGWQSQQSR